MFKSQPFGLLLVALVLSSAPAMSQVSVHIGGSAQLIHDGAYLAMDQSSVALGAHANAGDMIGIAIVAIDKSGQPDYSTLTVLMAEVDSLTGVVAGKFEVPSMLAGLSFLVIGGAINVDGDLFLDSATLTIGSSQDANSV